ncbi:MAG: hypothetical protein HFG34_11270 [Eubacterium sp.]|nr:hypothetical protein [Eubacterium sp.]
MGQRKIFICMTDLNYGSRLARYLTSQYNSGIEVELLTGRKDKADVGDGDIALSDDPKILEDLQCQTVLFVKTPEEKGKNKIFMFCSREEIYNELVKLTGTREGNNRNRSQKESGIIVVFSPEGGDEKTLLALKRAGELSRNKRVLYLSLCGFPVFFDPSWKDESGGRDINFSPGITELMLRAEGEDFTQELENMAFQLGKIWSIAPVSHYKDLLDFSRDDICRFMKGLKEQSMFEAVVLELGQIFEYTLDLMTYADQILIPRESGVLAAIRRNVLQRYCGMEGKPQLWERMTFEETEFSIPKKKEELLRFIGREEDRE